MRPSILMTIAAAESDASVAESSSVAMQMDEARFRAFYQETAPKLLAYVRRASRAFLQLVYSISAMAKPSAGIL